jgi:predicted O-linked N-acetylglucosamine transferase (SPINDLY family)
MHLLGAALHANNESGQALVPLREATRLEPGNPLPWNTLGAVQVEMGHPEEGEVALREALRLAPGYPEALFNLAQALKQRGELAAAKDALLQLVQLAPGLAAARFELANVLAASGEAVEALPIYEALLAQFPGDTRLLVSIAGAHQRMGNHALAGELCEQALMAPSIAPQEAATLAHTLASLGRVEDARAAALRAVASAPQSVEVRSLAGDALAHAGYPALAQEQYANVAIHRPRVAAVLQKLGIASIAARDWGRAAQAFEDQLRLAPGERTPLRLLAVSLMEMGARDEAIRAFERALDAGHRDAEILAALVQVKGMACDWRGLDALVAELREAALEPSSHPAQPQVGLYLAEVSAAEQRAWSENWARVAFAKIVPMTPERRRAHAKLRIGYLSADFYDHAVALLMVGMLESHDKGRFEVFAYSMAADDGSSTRRRIAGAVDAFVDLRDMPPRIAVERIAADGLDVLMDLGGYTKNSRMDILAHRLAPRQGHFLGYPGTTGASFIDFFVADAVTVPPGGEAGFSERVLRMPACYQPNDPRRIEPARRPRSEFGMPDDAIVLASFNQGVKLREPVFERWCRLLEAIPGALLLIADNGDAVNARLRDAARARNVDPARIVVAGYVPQADHMARLRNVDIALDTFPYSSHTTASDAVWAGVPLVTTYGETFASRVAASVLTAAGCAEGAFSDREQAFDATLALARQPELRRVARERLAAARSSLLFDAASFARDFENLLAADFEEHAR